MHRAVHASQAPAPTRATGGEGQAVVEFSLAILVFLLLIVGLFDIGRGVYTYNGVSQAAREIARRTIVHPGNPLGTSLETLATTTTQSRLVAGMGAPVFECVDITGAPSIHVPCQSGDFVRVTVSASYSPTSFLGLSGPINFQASSSLQIP